MNVNPTLIRAAIVAALAVLVPGGHGQDARSVTASLQAESDNNRLVLVAKHFTWVCKVFSVNWVSV